MARYFYDIFGDHPFVDPMGAEHPSDKAAWRDARRLIRDAEEHLSPNGRWMLAVREGNRRVYMIDVTAWQFVPE